MKRTRQVPGFTLVELLAVLVIVVVLASLLFPVFARVRERGRQSACASNLKQLGLAIQMYAEDNNGYFPAVYASSGNLMIDWTELMLPYVKDKQLYICPSDPNRQAWSNSYGLNYHLAGYSVMAGQVPTNSRPKNEGQVLRPAATVLMTDAGTTPASGVPPLEWPQKEQRTVAIADAFSTEITISNSDPSAPHARHSGRSNILWVDGHVSALPMESFYNSPGNLQPGNSIPGLSPCLRPSLGCP